MDASLQSRVEELAGEIAGQARTAEDLNGLMRLMMKSALERMLNTEMDRPSGTEARSAEPAGEPADPPQRRNRSPTARQAPRASNRRNGRSRKTVQGDRAT